jgi:hypothetical protein
MHRIMQPIALVILVAVAAPSVAQEDPPSPLAIHMAHMLEGSAQWRSPNPDYQPGSASSPEFFGVNWEWGSNDQHLIGEVTGIYADGRVARYHAMYAFYNPVTERVVMQQVGWDGTFSEGEHAVRTEPLRSGDVETVDMLAFAPDGRVTAIRHQGVIIDRTSHSMDVYGRNADGEWELEREWVWRLVEAE